MTLRFYLLFGLFISFPLYAYNPYSNTELDSLEKQFITEINLSPQVIRSPLAVDYLNQLGHRLTHAMHMPDATFFIVNSPEINAFAGPGGYIGVHSTLILTTTQEDELAAVMAHELAHVKLHHLYDIIEHEKLMRIPTMASMLAAVALGAVNPALGTGALAATLSGAVQQSINYTRSHEKEADRIGMQMLIKAGFHPAAMPHFFKKLQLETRYTDTDQIPAMLRTHPLDQERIAEAEDRLPKNKLPHMATSLNYELFKAMIRSQSIKQAKNLIEYYTKHPHQSAPQNQYGLALAYMETNHFHEAARLLLPLINTSPESAFYVSALAQAQIGMHDYKQAIVTLKNFYALHPQTFSMATMLAKAYLERNDIKEAASLLTKTFRYAPKDVMVCKMLAEAEAKLHRPGYAYFIEAQCDHLQGLDRLAIQRLKLAQKIAKKDSYLKARIDAKIEEIKQ